MHYASPVAFEVKESERWAEFPEVWALVNRYVPGQRLMISMVN